MYTDIDEFLSADTYAETTKLTYSKILIKIFDQVTANLTASELLKILKQTGWGNSRQCVALACTQKYLAWKYGRQHPALTAKLKRETGKPQRALTEAQALELLASFDTSTSTGARDLAICSLALDTGLRCNELCTVTQANTDLEHCTLQVVVKGGQWRAAVFSPETAAHIQRWKWFRERIPGLNTLFNRVRTGRALVPEELNRIVSGWGKSIGIQLSPHDLRRSFACLSTTLTQTPERILMEGGRWANSEMINRYTRTLKLEAMRSHLIIPKLIK